jgi:hypothetical protein
MPRTARNPLLLLLTVVVPQLLLTAQTPTVVTGGGFVAGGQVLFATDFSQDRVGNFPSGLKYVRGPLEVVLVDGVSMLRSIGPAEFIIPLAQPLPQDFTLEFDVVARNSNCCSGEELAFEGSPELNRSPGSAWVSWHHQYAAILGGGQDMGSSTVRFSEDLQGELKGQLGQIQVMMSGTQFKLFTNGRQIYNIPNLVFRRSNVLRVYLGGLDDGTAAVYLARVRLAAGGGGAGVVANQQGGVTGSGIAGQPSGGAIQPVNTPPAPGTPVTGPSVTPPASAGAINSGPRPIGGAATATTQSSSTGTPLPTSLAGVSVSQGTAGPLVNWLPLSVPADYLVERWKIDDLSCCNNASSLIPPLTGPPWQDNPLSIAGTYVYKVTATTSAGKVSGQAQFVVLKQVGQIATPLSVPISPGATNASLALVVAGPSYLTAIGDIPTQIMLQWRAVPNATFYRFMRSSTVETKRSLGDWQVGSLRSDMSTGDFFHMDWPVDMTSTYSYEVIAGFVDAAGTMTFSRPSPLATAMSGRFVAPPNLKYTIAPSTVTGKLSVTVTWDAVYGAFAYYVVPSGSGTGSSWLPSPVGTNCVTFDDPSARGGGCGSVPLSILPYRSRLGLCVNTVYLRNIRDDSIRSCLTIDIP